MIDRLTTAVRAAVLLAGAAGLVVLALPEPQQAAAVTLPAGSYVVGIEDEAFAVWVPEDGAAVVVADEHVDVQLATDADGRALSRFLVEVDRALWNVEIDTSHPDLYLSAVSPLDAPSAEVIVATTYDEAEDAVRAVADEPEAGKPLFDPGETPMADRVNSVASLLQRGGDGVAGAANSLVDRVRGGGDEG